MNRLLFSIYLFLLPLAIFGQTEGSGDIQRIAESGNTDAQNDLGVLYYNGEGVAKDLAKAAEWYRKAAEKKHVRAQYNLGILYLDKEDFVSAAYWFGKAAEQGHAKALTNLGTLYYYGVGVTQDVDMAMELYNKAVGKGDERARSNLIQLGLQTAQSKQTAQNEPTETAEISSQNTKPVALDNVDTEIPCSGFVNNTLFAVIIGNEKYDEESDVP